VVVAAVAVGAARPSFPRSFFCRNVFLREPAPRPAPFFLSFPYEKTDSLA
jgi:hypothetical protein